MIRFALFFVAIWLGCVIAILDRSMTAKAFATPLQDNVDIASSDAPASSDDDRSEATAPKSLAVGLDGVYRPGIWTMVKPSDDLREAIGSQDRVSVQTLDGDGVKVFYEQNVAPDSNLLYAVPGIAGVPLVILDAEGAEVYRGRFTGKAIEPRMPWVVVFGDTLGIETIGRNEILGRESSVAVSNIESASDFPDQLIGLSGVDLVVIGPSGRAVLSQLSPAQANTLTRWVSRGGRMLVSLGREAESMLNDVPWLRTLVALDESAQTIRLDPSSIETFTSSQNRLPTLEAIQLPARGGETIISGRNTSRQPTRAATENSVGLGRVVITAFALDSEALKEWPQRTALVGRLCGDLFSEDGESRRDARSGASVGYDDIAGQVRMALDRFESRRRIPYSIISLVLVALIALIGPLDYLVVNRLFGRPLLGWLTFPLSVLLVSGVLIALGRPAQSASDPTSQSSAQSASDEKTKITINRMEIVDIDLTGEQPQGRGWAWTHLYSLEAAQADFMANVSPTLVSEGSTPIRTSSPFGYPGSTFGGISIAGEDTRLPAYKVSMAVNDDGVTSQVSGIPLAPGGSKSVATRWTFVPKVSGKSDLARRRGSELLEGSLTNSLPVDILNGSLVFGEWVYLLPTRFRSGQTIENIETLRQKNFRWLLARREALENSARSEPWNPEMYQDLPRLAEVLMFNTVAGGRDYTGLFNRPLLDLDLSYLLSQDRAIMFGQLESPSLETLYPVQRASSSAVRVILPVGLPRLVRDGL